MAKPRKPPRGGVGLGDAVRAGQPSPKPKPLVFGNTLPPALTFDPGISAEMRAAERGLEDIKVDVGAARHFAKNDLAQALRDIKTSTQRSRGGINREFARTEQEFGDRESQVQLKAARANQDFDTQLQNIGRQFAQLGHRQGEAANAAGVLDSGTQAAAQAARSANQGLAEAPVNTARERVGEDLATALRQLGTGREDLGEDRDRELTQLLTDRDRERKLSKQQTGRTMFGLKHKLQRAIREETYTEADKTAQAIYEARANRPGAFTKTGAPTKKGRRR